MEKKPNSLQIAVTSLTLGTLFMVFCSLQSQAQTNAAKPSPMPKYEVDPYWPKPLPNGWVTSDVAFVWCDPQDHVIVLNRQNLLDHDYDAGRQAPAIIEYDRDGNVVNAWGDGWGDLLPTGELHGFFVDHEGSVWIGGGDNILQKWAHDGSRLLLQIGLRGVLDWSLGASGNPAPASHAVKFSVQDLVTDPKTDDIYISGGNPASVMVFNRVGQFVRQWPVKNTPPGKNEGEPSQEARGLSMHCIVLSNDDFVYLCDRGGDQIQVYDKKTGEYLKSFYIPFEQRTPARPGWTHHAGGFSTTMHIALSHDPAQKYMFVANSANAQVDILDRATGKILTAFGRIGHQLGEFEDTHTLASDSKDNIYVAEGWHGVASGRRIQKFKLVGNQ